MSVKEQGRLGGLVVVSPSHSEGEVLPPGPVPAKRAVRVPYRPADTMQRRHRGGMMAAIQMYGAEKARLLYRHLDQEDWDEIVADAAVARIRRSYEWDKASKEVPRG